MLTRVSTDLDSHGLLGDVIQEVISDGHCVVTGEVKDWVHSLLVDDLQPRGRESVGWVIDIDRRGARNLRRLNAGWGGGEITRPRS